MLAVEKPDARINSLSPSHYNDFVLPLQTVNFTYFENDA